MTDISPDFRQRFCKTFPDFKGYDYVYKMGTKEAARFLLSELERLELEEGGYADYRTWQKAKKPLLSFLALANEKQNAKV